jgi:hypothetical protein
LSTSLEPLKACKKFKFGPKFCWGENICRPTEFKEFAVEVATILYHTWKRKELVEYDPTKLSLSSQKKHFFLWQVEEKVKSTRKCWHTRLLLHTWCKSHHPFFYLGEEP